MTELRRNMAIKSAVRFSFIAAIISTLKSYMLKPEDYEMLFKSASIDDAYEVLQRTYYRTCFSGAREKMEIETFERRMYEDYFNTFNKIYRACPKASLEVIDAMYLKHELYSLKMILRALLSGLDTESALQTVNPIGRYSPDVCRSILESRSIQTAIDSVKEIIALHRTLTDVLKQQKELLLPYLLEATIDRYSLMNLWKSLSIKILMFKLKNYQPFNIWNSLSPHSDSFARRIVGKMADLLNIMFILRSKYLGLEADVIPSFIIHIHQYLPSSELERVIQAPALRDAMQLLSLGHYGKLITRASLGLEIDQALSEIEINFDRYIAGECLYSFQGIRFHVGIIIAYLMLKFNEMSDIRAILFGKVNKLPIDDIRRKLILHHAFASR
ncbi:MAG: V-type ATPase subunit [archaeon]|nr:V-type ATPase subunit [archaeon]